MKKPGAVILVSISFLLLFISCIPGIPAWAEDENETDGPAVPFDSPVQKDGGEIPEGIPVIYVAENGSDTGGNGSISSPYATPDYAVSAAPSGAAVVLRGGSYTVESVAVETPDLIIMSYPGEWAVINGRDFDSPATIWYFPSGSGSRMERLEITGSYYAVKMETDWDTDTHSGTGVSDITIEDCILHDTADAVVKITPGCDYITIRRCEIYNSGQDTSGSPEGIDNVNGDYMLVEQTLFHHNDSYAAYAKGGSIGSVFDRCYVYACRGGFYLGYDTSPEWFDLTDNPDYYENINGTIKNCIIADVEGGGIGIFAAAGAKIFNNTIVNAASEFHNPLHFGLTFQDYDPDAGRPPAGNAEIRNNIFINSSSSNRDMVLIRYSDELGGMDAYEGPLVMSNNIYFAHGNTPQFRDNRPESEFQGSLSQWKAHISSDSDSFAADPLLLGNYHLSGSSPAVNNGYPLGEVAVDIDMDPRNSQPDIGADEVRDE